MANLISAEKIILKNHPEIKEDNIQQEQIKESVKTLKMINVNIEE